MSETQTPTTGTAATTLYAEVPADRLRTALAPVDALVEECRVRFDEDGLRVAAADPATVALVDLRIDAAAFDAYRAEEGRVGLDLDRLCSVLGVADRGDGVELTLDPETRRLRVSIGGLSYSLALLDPETVRAPPDRSEMEYELPGGAAVPETILSRGISAAEMVGDHVAVGVDAGGDDDSVLFLQANGDTDEASLRVPSADLDRFDPADVRSLYSLSYLRSMSRAIPSEICVDLGVGTDAPLSLSFDPDDGVHVDFLLAPRRQVN
jgi:proliferating cell nuclear antigen